MNKYRISEVKLNMGQDKSKLKGALAKKAKIRVEDIHSYDLVRESIDARKKADIRLVYTLDFTTKRKLRLDKAPDRTYQRPRANLAKDKKIVVVGFGPCGIFAGLILAQMGYRPLIIERGRDVDARSEDVRAFWEEGLLNPESNVQFGEGGAGTFSDGKLTSGISDARVYKVLEEFYKAGAPEEILYKHKPHIGTDLLKGVVKNIRKEIIRLGGQVRFSTRLEDLVIEDGVLKGLIVEDSQGKAQLACDRLVLAIGHSARDTFRMLYRNKCDLAQKQFSMGVRIEHPQKMIDEAQYGDEAHARVLGPAEYKLNYKTKSGRGVYTFCMCPGGEVVMASSRPGQLLTNGMSYHARDLPLANSAVLVDVRKEDYGSDDPLAGVLMQEEIEKKAYDVLGGYKLEGLGFKEFENSPLASVLPDFVVESLIEGIQAMDRKLKGFAGDKAIIKGPETRSSSPVRFIRDESFMTNIKNLYPGGEGAGYAGGIMSAAVDGIKIAEKIIEDK